MRSIAALTLLLLPLAAAASPVVDISPLEPFAGGVRVEIAVDVAPLESPSLTIPLAVPAFDGPAGEVESFLLSGGATGGLGFEGFLEAGSHTFFGEVGFELRDASGELGSGSTALADFTTLSQASVASLSDGNIVGLVFLELSGSELPRVIGDPLDWTLVIERSAELDGNPVEPTSGFFMLDLDARWNLATAPIPEPTGFVLFALGALLCAGRVARR